MYSLMLVLVIVLVWLVLSNPPTWQNGIVIICHRGDFEGFSGKMMSVLYQEGVREVLASPWHRVPCKVFDPLRHCAPSNWHC